MICAHFDYISEPSANPKNCGAIRGFKTFSHKKGIAEAMPFGARDGT